MLGVTPQQQQHLQGQKQMQHQGQMGLGQPPGFVPNNPMPSNGMVPMNNQQPAPLMPMNRPSGPGSMSHPMSRYKAAVMTLSLPAVGPGMVPISNNPVPMPNNFNAASHPFQNHQVPGNPAMIPSNPLTRQLSQPGLQSPQLGVAGEPTGGILPVLHILPSWPHQPG
jgi:hypothetical protein